MNQPNNSQPTTFWRTVPGILAQIAAVIVAITGLLAVLNATGIIGAESGPTTTNPGPGGSISTTDPEPTASSVTTAAPAATIVDTTTPTTPPPTTPTTTPATASSTTTSSTATTTTTLPVLSEPIVARVESPDLQIDAYAFFTREGLLITWVPEFVDMTDVGLRWTVAGQEFSGRGRSLGRGGLSDATLVELTSGEAPPTAIQYRNARSLSAGESIQLYLGEGQQNPGTVVNAAETIDSRVDLVHTTRITAPGQIGAPVIDDDSVVVAISFGASDDSSYSIAIERAQIDFPDAF